MKNLERSFWFASVLDEQQCSMNTQCRTQCSEHSLGSKKERGDSYSIALDSNESNWYLWKW